MRLQRFFHLACAVLAAYGAAAVWRDRHNTLQLYPEWTSVKTELALGVNGAHAFTLTPISLLRQQLNLGAWLGHQELRLDREWDEMPELSLRLGARGHSEWSLLARSLSGQPHFALRISSHPGRPTAWLILGNDREILSREEIPYSLPHRERVAVKLSRKEGRLVLAVNGKELGARSWPEGRWRLSLYGQSTKGVLAVDELKMSAKGQEYAQGFSGKFPWWLFLGGAPVLFLLVFLTEKKLGARPALSFSVGIGSLAALSLLFYNSLIGNQYPHHLNYGAYYGRKNNIDSREEIYTRLRALPPGRPVLLWLGGSQAWGAGASRPETSVFGRLGAMLAGSRLELVNGAVSGATLEDQLETIRLVSLRRLVAALVVTAGVNDATNKDFPAKLKLISTAAKQRDARLLLIVEPVEPPPGKYLQQRQKELLEFAAAEGIPAVNLQAVFEREIDTGYHWRDFVHFSDAGAAVAARELLEPVRKLIEGAR